MKLNQKGVDAFYNYARMRHQCYVRKIGDPHWLTRDKILQTYSFCNVFRELDKTTIWFRENVRDKMSKERGQNMVLATVAFRMFNRMETGEAMFRDDDLLGGHSAFDNFAATGKTSYLKEAIVRRIGKKGPYVTGSYIIAGPGGMSKLDGILEVIRRFYKGERPFGDRTMGWDEVTKHCQTKRTSLQQMHEWLSQFDYLGMFHSYEIVTDLRWTYVLGRAPDVNVWCNPGPGARRGMNRVLGRDKKTPWNGGTPELLEYMSLLLDESEEQWAWFANEQMKQFPKIKTPMTWEMRDIEHTLCEFDKYERTRAGEGRPRGRYKGYAKNG